MTKKPSNPLDLIPAVSGIYDPPPDEFLVPELRPLAQRVRRDAARWREAEANRRAVQRRNPAREYADAQFQAARDGLDPAEVPDPRPQHAATLERSREAETACLHAVRSSWTELVRATVAHRADCLAGIEPLVEQSQAEALDALDRFLAARHRLDQALGLVGWLEALRPTGGQHGVSTGQGPRALNPHAEVLWADRHGRHHQMPASLLRAGLEVWARGLDSLKVTRERVELIRRRAAGDRAAQQTPVPPDRLTVG